ncbi:MAG TPA: relaxase/mobilization nuclease domain-containing protein [Puia sp.]|nr:relaxase/mobilization nuclease domain-containing protein [Puia sp.]
MIGRVKTPRSFGKALGYCLEDKLLPDGLAIFKDRAEIIQYNLCSGDKTELVAQFDEVRRLNPNMSQPVMHIVLSLPRGENIPKGKLTEIASDCARAMDFDKHQFVTILHKDTTQQHVHLVANRVGTDNHTVSDSYSYGRLADFCRQAEKKHQLTPELSPRRYQSEEQLKIPRHGIRLDLLKKNIGEALTQSRSFADFEQHMRDKAYSIHKQQRGITFRDEKNVIFKGSEAGYSLKTIEANLAIKLELRQRQARENERLLQQREKERKQELKQEFRQSQEREQRQQRRPSLRMRMG